MMQELGLNLILSKPAYIHRVVPSPHLCILTNVHKHLGDDIVEEEAETPMMHPAGLP